MDQRTPKRADTRPESRLPKGTTLRLLLIECNCPPERLASHQALLPLLSAAVVASEMTPLSAAGHDFVGAGCSLCVILAESHLVAHTYPELSQSAIVELSVCDHSRSNRERALLLADRVIDLFQPVQHVLEEHPFPTLPEGPMPAPSRSA
jgi:S-adenosylmethionine/arginine decarboxylase-like enzyme